MARHTKDSGLAPSYRSKSDRWWKIHLFRGVIDDIRRRAPYYGSDIRDAWDYRVVPATIYMYFAKYASPCFEFMFSPPQSPTDE
jgi:boron transporter